MATLDLHREQASAPGSPRPSSTASPSASSARRRRADVQGLPRLPRLDLRLAERDDRARHPRPLPPERGDIISIDVGVTLDGWVADAARTFPVGESRPRGAEPARRHRARRCTPASSSAVRATASGDVSTRSRASPRRAGSRSCARSSATASGADMHEDPQVPNYGKPGKGPLLEEGMVLAIEPMTTAGRPGVRVGRRRLGDLLAGRLAGGALRVHRRDHRRRAPRADALAPRAAEAGGRNAPRLRACAQPPAEQAASHVAGRPCRTG